MRNARSILFGGFALVMAAPVLLAQEDSGSVAGSVGPDIVVSVLAYDQVGSFGSEYTNGVSCDDPDNEGPLLPPLDCTAAFSLGTTSCNIGDVAADWVADTRHHPVIRQGVFRLLNGKFEQIGTSWVKHGFLAVNQESPCGTGSDCINPNVAGDNLRPGCADPYSASLNSNRFYLGPASEINAFTGYFLYPPILDTGSGRIANRLQIRHPDLDPTLNPLARYFGQGHYVAADDALAGNSDNNASYRELDVLLYGDYINPFTQALCLAPYCLTTSASTGVGDPAIRAWGVVDASVRLTDAHVPGEGMFILGSKVTNLGTGFWRYEYALFNLNSDRGGATFEVPVPEGAIVQNIGFHDVDYHSGEPWDGTDWSTTLSGQKLIWSTTPYETDPNANALRWSTLYNFRLDVSVPPEDSAVIVGLFKPGQPETLAIRTNAPRLELVDCNQNGIADQCDVSCAPPGCELQDCGQFDDCNGNGVPDHPLCEADCNENGIPDQCDILFCEGELWCGDCNGNTAPDECDEDCDGNGVPDDCEPFPDLDGDGVDNCYDLCPETTPPDACDPPNTAMCRFNNGFCFETTRSGCIIQGGTPVCGNSPFCSLLTPCPESLCRDGCIVGDFDSDGDVDVSDVGYLQACFSGDISTEKYVLPSQQCLLHFDFDEDNDVDLADYLNLIAALVGP